MNIAIGTNDVAHSFTRGGKSLAALENISIEIRTGEMVCLLGPSGCGKSTLLNIIGGVIAPDRGTVTVDGAPLTGIVPNKISFVFQEHALFPWNTVKENLAVALEFQGVPAAEREQRVNDALAAVRMTEFADFYPAQLSGGMRQRVALARGLCLQTEILLLDEPFAALDEQTRMIFGEDLSVLLATTRKTMVLVTHSLSEAVYLCDRIFVMSARPGRIKAVVDVPQPHPRTPDFVSSSLFGELRAQLYELLHDEIRASVESADQVSGRRSLA